MCGGMQRAYMRESDAIRYQIYERATDGRETNDYGERNMNTKNAAQILDKEGENYGE